MAAEQAPGCRKAADSGHAVLAGRLSRPREALERTFLKFMGVRQPPVPVFKEQHVRPVGTQYLTEARLSVHLRDSPWSTSVLRKKGHYTLRSGQVLEARNGGERPQSSTRWPQLKESRTRWRTLPLEVGTMRLVQSTRGFAAIFSGHPLRRLLRALLWSLNDALFYACDETDICGFIGEEIRDLPCREPQLIWGTDSIKRVPQALETAMCRQEFDGSQASDGRHVTLQDFAADVAKINWSEVIAGCKANCETPEPASEMLNMLGRGKACV